MPSVRAAGANSPVTVGPMNRLQAVPRLLSKPDVSLPQSSVQAAGEITGSQATTPAIVRRLRETDVPGACEILQNHVMYAKPKPAYRSTSLYDKHIFCEQILSMSSRQQIGTKRKEVRTDCRCTASSAKALT